MTRTKRPRQAAEDRPSFWTTFPGLLTAVAAVLTAIGGLIATLAAVGVFSAAPSDATQKPSPSMTTSGSNPLVACNGDLETTIGGTLSPSQPSYRASRDLCVTHLVLYETTIGNGTARLTVAGKDVYAIDLTNFDTLGTEGAGSGERDVTLGRAIGVAGGQTLAIDYDECTNCGGLIISFDAASP